MTNVSISKIKESLSLKNILFFLFVFELIVDPANTIFHIKDLVFVLLFIYMLFMRKEVDSTMFVFILSIYALITASLFIGVVADYSFETDFTVYIYKTFAPLLLLLWVRQIRFFTWRTMLFPSIIVCAVSVFISISVIFFPAIEDFLYEFAINSQVVNMGRRNFLGISMFGVYYRSLPLVLIPATFLLYAAVFSPGRKIWCWIGTIIMFAALLTAGTRACMLAAVVIIAFIASHKLMEKEFGQLLLFFTALLFIPLFLFIVYKLVAEIGEPSNVVKYGHLESYIDLIIDDPFVLLTGSGPGSRFFSKGFGIYTEQTEWSYLEFIRMFGFGTTLLLVFVYFFPLYKAYKCRKSLEYSYAFILSYSLYLMVAGTNPLLLGSNGTLSLLYAYNYVYCGNKIV